MQPEPLSPLVTPTWLHAHLGDDDLVILMTRMSDIKTGAPEATPPCYIPGAQLCDFETDFADKQSGLPHTLPSPEQFQAAAQKLGINNNSLIVVYDNQGLMTAPRVWWMFKTMGHADICVLDGGLPAWQQQQLPVAQALAKPPSSGNFQAQPAFELVCDQQQVKAALSDSQVQIIDARAAGRFYGREPEPRPGLRSGHMPGASNIPYSKLVEHGVLKDRIELERLFCEAGASTDKQLILSCGSGVTASGLALAATLCGFDKVSVYDGSWSEWGRPGDTPVVTD